MTSRNSERRSDRGDSQESTESDAMWIEDLPPREETGNPPSPPGRSRGIGWGWIFGVAAFVAIALVGMGAWGVHEMMQRELVRPIRTVFRDVSLMPNQSPRLAQPEQQIKLFYLVRGRALSPQTRELPRAAGAIERLHAIIEALRAPPDAGLIEGPLPPGTDVRGLYVLDGIVWLDLGETFRRPAEAGPLRERLTVYSLVNSLLLNNPQFQGVQFMIEGRPVQTAWGWLDLSSPLGPDLSMIH